MRRKIIALDTSSTPWQLAVSSAGKGRPQVEQLAQLEHDPQRPLADQLHEALGSPLETGDRLAVCLPASRTLVRWVRFPFTDSKKIAAATPQELASQLPCDLDSYQVGQCRMPSLADEQTTILAAAVPTEAIESLLNSFDDDREPLGFIGLAPFISADGLAEQLPDGLLIQVSGDEICLARQQAGALRDLRIRPLSRNQQSIDHVEFILRQARVLLGVAGEQKSIITLTGAAADSELAKALRMAGLEIVIPELQCQGQSLPPQQMLAGLLALAAARQARTTLNFRSGPFALKNEWQASKRRLLGVGALLAATLVLLSAAAWVNYTQRSNRLDQLKMAMNQRYLQAFPGEKAVVDAALQLQVKLRQLRDKRSQLGSGESSALKVLLEVSARCPEKFKLDIREYSFSPTGVRLGGTTDSFDAVTQIARSLKASPMFGEVKISDTKQKPRDERVEFRLQLNYATAGGAS